MLRQSHLCVCAAVQYIFLFLGAQVKKSCYKEAKYKKVMIYINTSNVHVHVSACKIQEETHSENLTAEDHHNRKELFLFSPIRSLICVVTFQETKMLPVVLSLM